MFSTIWKVVSEVDNPSVTRIWRLGVTLLLLLAYGSGVSFITWAVKDSQDIRLQYVTQIDFDKKCDDIQQEFRTSCQEIATAVDKMRESNDQLRLLLLKKFMTDKNED